MANSKELLERINSVSLMQQMTKTMKLISASKFVKSQNILFSSRKFIDELIKIGNTLIKNNKKNNDIVITNRSLVVAVSSDKGFCGAFNNNICKKVKELITNNETEIMPIGKKIYSFVNKGNYNCNSNNVDLLKKIDENVIKNVAISIYNKFSTGKYDNVIVIYNKFINASSQVVTVENILDKVDFITKNNDFEDNLECSTDMNTTNIEDEFIFESSKNDIDIFLKENVFIYNFLRVIYESNASEHASRMITMNKANDNAESLIKSLRILYNQTRQSAITNEIIEISAGAKCLNTSF